MATTPEEEFYERSHVGDQAKEIVESMRQTVAGGRDYSAIPVILLAVVAAALSAVPDPFIRGAGVGLCVYLAFLIARRMR
jgi:hypothetical protein